MILGQDFSLIHRNVSQHLGAHVALYTKVQLGSGIAAESPLKSAPAK